MNKTSRRTGGHGLLNDNKLTQWAHAPIKLLHK